jgi:hypothetical protein
MEKVKTEQELLAEKIEEGKANYEMRWNAVIPKIKKAYPTFTDADLKHIEGSEHKRWKIMLKKTGLTRDNLIIFISSLEKN